MYGVQSTPYICVHMSLLAGLDEDGHTTAGRLIGDWLATELWCVWPAHWDSDTGNCGQRRRASRRRLRKTLRV